MYYNIIEITYMYFFNMSSAAKVKAAGIDPTAFVYIFWYINYRYMFLWRYSDLHSEGNDLIFTHCIESLNDLL